MAKSMKSLLAKGAKNWKTATKRESSFGSNLEDGPYIMKVTDVELTESQSSGRPQVKWEFTVQEGESKGQKAYEYDGIETEDNLYFLQRRIARLGYEIPDDISELETLLAKIAKEKPVARCKVQTKDEYQHVYVNRLVNDADAEPEGAEGEPEEPDADEPETETCKACEGTGKSSKGKTCVPCKGTGEVVVEAEAEPEPEEPEAESEGFEEGDAVTFKLKGKEVEGTFVKTADDDMVVVECDGKKYKLAADKIAAVESEPEPEPEPEEPETEADADGNFEVRIKDKITWKSIKTKKKLIGTVTEILEDGVRAKLPDGTVVKVLDGDYELAK